MKQLLLPACLFFSGMGANAQTTLYTETFDGASVSMSLNTTDNSSTASGYNLWVVNNNYTGGSGSLSCMGIPFTYNINATQTQPAGISGNPSSKYLHLFSTEAQTDGILCSSYLAADGVCNFSQNYFSKMSSDISTAGYANVTLKFWWLCGGSTDAYGRVYYSTNGGTSWTPLSTNYSGSPATWQQATVTDPAFNNQATLRFGFQFVNNVTTSASDPGFSLDDVSITGATATGIAKVSQSMKVSVSPNPFNETLHLNLEGMHAEKDLTLTVYNLLGESLRRIELPYSNTCEVSLQGLAPGIYLLSVANGETVATTRVVKE